MGFPVLAAAFFVFPISGAETNAVKDELARLQGRWELVQLHTEGRKWPSQAVSRVQLTFSTDSRYRQEVPSGEGAAGVFAIDPTAKPKLLDFRPETGHFKGVASFCIYELKGEWLRIYNVTDSTDAKDRPSEFPSGYVKSKFTYTIYRRAKPD